ncbi:dTMP kinase [Methylobacillus sp. Pita2]|uniref:dTMP kinase n=1 Tax=Methylobacillus sp. Pita2 TaxID=3383245 RepID=UPI0038B562C9
MFITLEGQDGSGKSSQIPAITGLLEGLGHAVVSTREPGGTPVSEALRAMLLKDDMDPVTETMLICAARKQHIEEVISPALSRGDAVVSDRFFDSTYAYQHGGRGVPEDTIFTLSKIAQGDLQPDLTLLFDVPESVCLERMQGSRVADRFEKESLDFFTRVRNAYLSLAERNPERVVVIDSHQPIEAVAKDVEAAVKLFLARKKPAMRA